MGGSEAAALMRTIIAKTRSEIVSSGSGLDF